MYDGVPFYVESGSRDSGRRTVTHEFPKRDKPYSEDMGQRAIEYNVRGYVICYPKDVGLVQNIGGTAFYPSGGLAQSLYMRDYRIARDLLQSRLDAGGQGVLQLPYMARAAFGDSLVLMAVCTRYRMTEEDRFGGYATFDMTFVDYGLLQATAPVPSIVTLMKTASDTYLLITTKLTNGPPTPVEPSWAESVGE